MKEIIFWEQSEEVPDAASHKAFQHQKMDETLESLVKQKNDFTGVQYWRFHTIDMLEELLKVEIHGKCLEIGSGKGLASAYLSSKISVQSVMALDYSLYSLEYLLPKAQRLFKDANLSKIQRVFGSFNNIKAYGYDFVFGFGAIHNSDNLESTFKSIYQSLKDGGVFMSSDMALYPSTSINLEKSLTDRIVPNSKQNYGKELKYRETNDYFRNIVDYIYFAKNAGFQVTVIGFNKNGSRKRKLDLQGLKSMSGIATIYPSKARGPYDNFMIICEKLENFDYDLEGTEDKSTLYTLSYYLNRLLFIFKNPKIGMKRLIIKVLGNKVR